MKKRRWLWLTPLILIVVVLIATVAAWNWLTGTRAGAEWLLTRAEGSVPELRWDTLEGTLGRGLIMTGVHARPGNTGIDAQRVELAAHLDLLPAPKLVIQRLRVSHARIELPVGTAGDEPDAVPALPAIDLPVGVALRELHIAPLDIVSADGTTTRLESIRAAAGLDDRLVLHELAVQHGPTRLRASGHANLTGTWPLDLEIDLEHTLEGGTQTANLALGGTLANLDVRLDTEGPVTGRLRGSVTGLPGNVRVDARVQAARAGWPGMPGGLENVELELAGSIADWTLDGTLTAVHAGYPPADIQLDLRGNRDEIVAETLGADWLGGRLTAAGNLRTADMSGSLRLDLDAIEVRRLYPEVPVEAPVSGGVQFHRDGNRLAFEKLELRAPPLDLEVTGEGEVDFAADRIDARIEWQALTWPPGAGDDTAVVASEHGSLRVDGRLSDWRAHLEAAFRPSGLKQTASVDLEAAGDRDGARLERLAITGPAGNLRGSGRVQWRDTTSLRLDLELDGINPGVVDPRMAGDLNGRVSLTIEAGATDPPVIALELGEVSGTWRERPVRAAGTLRLVGTRPGASDLELAVGDNVLALESGAGRAWDWRLAAPDLSAAWPGLGGHLDLTGRVIPATLEIAVQGNGGDLAWENLRLSALNIDADWQLGGTPGRLDTRLELTDLALRPWERYETVVFRIDGTCTDHKVNLHADGDRGRLELGATSRLGGCPPAFDDWSARLDELALAGTDAGDWRLDAGAELTFRPDDGLTTSPLCLVPGDDARARVCLTVTDIRAGSGSVRAELDALPVNLLLLPVNPGFTLDSRLDGELAVGWSPAGLTRAEGRLRASAGRWQQKGPDTPGLDIAGARLDLSRPEPGSLRLELGAELEGSTRLNGTAVLHGPGDLATARLDGHLDLHAPDLSVFTRLTPAIDRLAGRLEARLETGGPLDALRTTGEIRLHEGRVMHAPTGMDLTDIGLTLRSGAEGMRLEGGFAAGQGRGSVTGSLTGSATDPRLALELAGSDLALFDTDWLSLTASPDLSMTLADRRIRLDGRLDIPHARIGLPPGTEGRVNASEDVVIAGSEPDRAESSERGGPELDGSVTVALGDDVRFDGMGLETALAGEVRLDWDGRGFVPDGDGLIRLDEGTYQAYGQSLAIRDGEILFANQSVDNPRLDIRAVREIFGDPVVETAGVSITGSAQRPEIELFTDPPTSREKALAYVATGANFDHAAGVGAFNLGFELLPDLFVSYGIGLFEKGNVLSARYRLSRRWGVRATSGERDTGIDFSYVLDR